MAAGNSTRFGSNKLLYPIDGKFMFEHGLDLLSCCIREGVLDAAVAVTQYSAVADAAAARGLSVAENPNSFLAFPPPSRWAYMPWEIKTPVFFWWPISPI